MRKSQLLSTPATEVALRMEFCLQFSALYLVGGLSIMTAMATKTS